MFTERESGVISSFQPRACANIKDICNWAVLHKRETFINRNLEINQVYPARRLTKTSVGDAVGQKARTYKKEGSLRRRGEDTQEGRRGHTKKANHRQEQDPPPLLQKRT